MITKLWPFLLLLSISISCSPSKEEQPKKESGGTGKKVILILGDSLTAGHGLESPEDSYPSLLQEKLDTDFSNQYEIRNAGVSGDTTSGGFSRLDWILQSKIDYFVLELGANDGMRGLDPKLVYQNLLQIIDKVRANNPNIPILVLGMKMFPSMGPKYVKSFDAIYPKLARNRKIHLMPFLLDRVAGDPKLNQKDGIHPTKEGHRILANAVYPYLKEMLQSGH